MLAASFKLGRIAGVSVNLHWSVALIALLLGGGLARPLGYGAAAAGVVLFLGSILVHELSHALIARRFDVGTRSIELWALGGMARLEREAPSPKAEGWIAAAGPLASIAVGVVSLAAWVGLERAGSLPTIASVLGWLGFINLALALFNLLPGAPLDGGRIVKAVRWRIHGDRHRATRDAARAGTFLGWSIAGAGLWLMLSGSSGLLLIVTGAFIAVNAKSEMMSAYIAERLDGVKVRDLTWFGVAAAGTDMDADTMLWQRQRLGLAGAVAISGPDGSLDGLVLEDQMWAIPADQRPWVMLTQLMVPFNRLAQADPDEDLANVLPRLNPRRPVVTVWRDGKLLGVVPPARLRERILSAQ
ncbi:MAG: site-2 protease family protein [Ilumatobacteraceae bacterium]